MTQSKTAIVRDCCGAKTRGGGVCSLPAGWGTDHLGQGKCKLHGGATPIKSGRYSKIKRDSLRELIQQFEADPDPLNIFPELAAARALFQDFIERYDQWAEALIAWHQSYQAGQRPISREKADALLNVIDQYEETIASEDDLTERQEHSLKLAREFVGALREGTNNKPVQVLDVADAYRIVSEITKIVARIETIRSQNAISRPDLIRVMTEMGRVVQTYVSDEAILEKVKEGWLTIHV